MSSVNTEERWRILIKDWESSGLKPSKFCKDHNLELGVFYYKRRKYSSIVLANPSKKRSLSLLPVKVSSKEPSCLPIKSSSSPTTVNIKLKNGMEINCSDTSNIEFISNLLSLVV
tara:strand:- start:1361 stop:1705 length:345 start_codon:yes stop_codon:yes gene_type:complete